MERPRVATAGLGIVLAGVMLVSCSSGDHTARHRPPTPKESAVALGHRMLDHVVLPAGARRSTAAAPSGLGGPSVPGIGNLEFAHRFWTISEDPHAVYRWMQLHPPQGFLRSETSTGTNGGVPTWGVTYAVAVAPVNISDAELQFEMAGNHSGGTTVRVDTVVGWTDPRRIDEYVSPSDRAVTVTVVHTFDPAGPPGESVVTTDPTAVRLLANTFNRLDVAPPEGVHGCPPMGLHTVSYRIAFAPSPRCDAARRRDDRKVQPRSCSDNLRESGTELPRPFW